MARSESTVTEADPEEYHIEYVEGCDETRLVVTTDRVTVTIEGETLALPDPFVVIATQNPIEMEGTFELPEAQRDRFLLKLTVDIPERTEERRVLDRFNDAHRNWEFFWFPHTDTALVKTFDTVPAGADSRLDRDRSAEDGVLAGLDAWVENTAWEAICRLGTRYPATSKHGARLAAATLSDKIEVGPSADVFANPRNVRFDETEYGLPAGDLPAAVREIRQFIDEEDVPVQFPIECRFVGADDPYLSPAHGRDSGFVAVHTYHQKSLPGYFERCEAILDSYDGRPHWGKMHEQTASDLAGRYPEWDAFQSVRAGLDPDGLFLNDHLQRVLVGDSGGQA